MVKIGIFGGTFDPVHNEHINIAKAALSELKLDKLIIMPTFISPHKADKKTVKASDRLAMCRLAFDFDSRIEISDFEIKNEGKSYSYLTVKHFAEVFSGAKLYFLVGADMLFDFKNWKNPDLILQYATLTVARREKQIKNIKKTADDFYLKFNKRIKYLKYIGGDISSTKVRRLCSLSQNLSKYVPENVAEYIVANNLYYDSICEYAKKRLSEKRFIHTLGVVELAVKLSDIYKISEEKAFYAALLHDIGKGYETEYKITLEEDVPIPVYHQFIGAQIAKTELNIEDEEIINAIKYHTSGRVKMSELEKLIFVADMLEDGRSFKGVETLRKYLDKPKLCFEKCLEKQYEFLVSTKKEIYNLTVKAYNYYCIPKGEN